MERTTKITQKTNLLELLYSKEVKNINTCIFDGKESIYEHGKIQILFDKVLSNEKKYTRDNLVQIVDIFENYGWYVKIIESEGIFDFS